MGLGLLIVELLIVEFLVSYGKRGGHFYGNQGRTCLRETRVDTFTGNKGGHFYSCARYPLNCSPFCLGSMPVEFVPSFEGTS